jgi:hypothetical protein
MTRFPEAVEMLLQVSVVLYADPCLFLVADAEFSGLLVYATSLRTNLHASGMCEADGQQA